MKHRIRKIIIATLLAVCMAVNVMAPLAADSAPQSGIRQITGAELELLLEDLPEEERDAFLEQLEELNEDTEEQAEIEENVTEDAEEEVISEQVGEYDETEQEEKTPETDAVETQETESLASTDGIDQEWGWDTTSLAAGYAHSLYLDDDGVVWAWGSNQYGQLGTGTGEDSLTPIKVEALEPGTVAKIYAGGFHSFAVMEDGSLLAWGRNAYGQLGDGTTTDRPEPVAVSSLDNVKQVAVGGFFTVALLEDGSVWTFGRNNSGQLGNGTTTNSRVPVQVEGLAGIIGVAAGGSHSLALDSNLNAWAWGLNTYGQLGDGTEVDSSNPVQVDFSGLYYVSAGANQSHGTFGDYSIVSWGHNSRGQLGNGTTQNSNVPTDVSGFYDTPIVKAGRLHALGWTSYGDLYAWGYNNYGQLGNGTNTQKTSPIQVESLSNIVGLATTYEHNLAVDADGNVWAWGANESGQLGDGTTTNQNVPVKIELGSTPEPREPETKISIGDAFSMMLDEEGTLWGWGDSYYVSGSSGYNISTVQELQHDIADVDSGSGHLLTIREDGTVWSWGTNYSGQLGDDSTTHAFGPQNARQAIGLTDVVAVAAGGDHSLALKSDGTVWAWGTNYNYQLGTDAITRSLVPVQVEGLSSITTIVTSRYHNFAVAEDGTLWGWGYNEYGQLGVGDRDDRSVPTQIDWQGTVKTIVTGEIMSLILDEDGTVWYCGVRSAEEDDTVNTFTQVEGLSHVSAISAGDAHIMVLKDDGSVWGWSVGFWLDVGYAVVDWPHEPFRFDTLPEIQYIASGGGSNIAIDTQDRYWGWGGNGSGEIGDGTRYTVEKPVLVLQDDRPDNREDAEIEFLAPKPDHPVYWDVVVRTDSQDDIDWVALEATEEMLVDINMFCELPLNRQYLQVEAYLNHSAQPQELPLNRVHLQAGDTLHIRVSYTNSSNVDPFYTNLFIRQSVEGDLLLSREGMTLSSGGRHTVLLEEDGSLLVWGYINYGHQGSGVIGQSTPLSPLKVETPADFVSVVAGYDYTLALAADGTVWSWGENRYGQLGNGTRVSQAGPTPSLMTDAIAITTNSTFEYSAAVRNDGTVWHWGAIDWSFYSEIPIQVEGLTDIVDVVVDSSFGLALKSDGTVWGWGSDGAHLTRPDSYDYLTTAVQLEGLSNVKAIASGTGCYAILEDGMVMAWGSGYLGDGNNHSSTPTPITLPGLSNIISIHSGLWHTMALDEDGSVWVWGNNMWKLFGDPSLSTSRDPVRLTTLPSNIQKIAMGRIACYAVDEDDGIWGWGTTVGDGTNTQRTAPVFVR